MKRSYRLIGAFLDHRPESNTSLEPVAYDPFYLEAGHPDCLFDCEGKRRYITLTEIFAVDSQQELDAILSQLTDCSDIGVICDCEPASRGSVPRRFFQHRALQAIRLLENRLPHATVKLMQPPSLELPA